MKKVNKKFLEEIEHPYYYIDFDCTLAKSIDPIVKILNEKFNKNLKPKDIKTWNFKEYHKEISDEDIDNIFSQDEFFDSLELYEGAKEFLLENIENCLIVTKGTPENIKKKVEWLKTQGLDKVKLIGLPLYMSKNIINMQITKDNRTSVFIDDCTSNLEETNASIKIQFREFGKTEWNKGWKGYILKSWK